MRDPEYVSGFQLSDGSIVKSYADAIDQERLLDLKQWCLEHLNGVHPNNAFMVLTRDWIMTRKPEPEFEVDLPVPGVETAPDPAPVQVALPDDDFPF